DRAEPVRDPPAQRQRQHTARGHGEQRQAEAAVAQVERLLDGRQPGAPRREAHAEDEEVAENRDPGVTKLGRRHAPVPREGLRGARWALTARARSASSGTSVTATAAAR